MQWLVVAVLLMVPGIRLATHAAVVRWSSSQQDLSVPFRSRPGLTGGFLLMAIIWRTDS